jgi:hypothetical protein
MKTNAVGQSGKNMEERNSKRVKREEKGTRRSGGVNWNKVETASPPIDLLVCHVSVSMCSAE